jgi:hypothetical protein
MASRVSVAPVIGRLPVMSDNGLLTVSVPGLGYEEEVIPPPGGREMSAFE